jgi:hypothetical protein
MKNDGKQGSFLEWFKSYLINRKQRMELKSHSAHKSFEM